MIINVYNEDDINVEFDYKKVVFDIEKELKNNKEVSLIIVNIKRIHEMNKLYRNIDRPTDVISFEENDEEDDNYLGDIFICIEKVYEQAKLYEHSNEREFAFLLVHGILHLSGFDHIKKEDEEIMFKRQEEILNNTDYRR